MKFVLLAVLVCLVASVTAASDDDVDEFWKIVKGLVKFLISKIHFHPDTGLNIEQSSFKKMKFVLLSAIVILVVANIKTVRDEEEKKVWELVWNHLKSLVSGVELHPDTGLNIYQFLEKYNYTLESHDVHTEDGYILTVHRVPHGRNQELKTFKTGIKEDATRPVVLLAHCLACSSMDWIWQGPNTSLALLLADTGYDVWLLNTRGNAHSLRHQTLTPSNASFWDFSFHEKGYYDIASTIDYILNKTNVEKITYVGHSQGTTGGLVLTSSKPEYNDKLNLMVLLSPIAYINHSTSPMVQLLVKYNSMIKLVLSLLGIHGLEYNPSLSLLTDLLCNDSSSLQGLCILIIDLFAGFDADQVDRSMLTVFLTNTPSGLSVKDIEHYTQEVTSGAFRQYDYGNSIANVLHYGTSKPPSYDITKVTAPLAVYYAKNDFLASVTDVERFLSELNVDTVERYLIDYEYFNHLDFITAKDVKTLLYDRVIELIKDKNPVN